MSDDDLSPFADDPILRALTAPGTAEELAGESEALAAFAAAVPKRPRRRYVGRLGIVSGSAVGLAVALSGGVAAAYTGSLPTPVQQVFHDLLRPLGVPAPDRHPTSNNEAGQRGGDTGVRVTTTPTPTPLPSRPTSKPKPQRSKHHVAASKRPTPATSPSAKPTPTATPTPVATPTPTPTPTETAPVPGDSITISVSDATATPGGTVTAYGRLATADGDPIAGVDVWLLERVAGGSGASEVASATTGADGTVSITTPPLTRSVRLRLVTDTKVDSAAIAVIVEPTVTVTVTPEGETSSVRIDTTGGDPGDTVNVEIRRAGGWQRFVSTQLDGDGGATIGVTNPQQRADHYRAVLPMTAGHGYAETRFSVARQ